MSSLSFACGGSPGSGGQEPIMLPFGVSVALQRGLSCPYHGVLQYIVAIQFSNIFLTFQCTCTPMHTLTNKPNILVECGSLCLYSQHSEDQGRKTNVMLTPAWATCLSIPSCLSVYVPELTQFNLIPISWRLGMWCAFFLRQVLVQSGQQHFYEPCPQPCFVFPFSLKFIFIVINKPI